MRIVGLLLLTVSFMCCREPVKRVNVFSLNGVIVADTAASPDRYLEWDEHTGYPIYYIGPVSDTIGIGRQFIEGLTVWSNYYGQPASLSYSDKTLQIEVDTSLHTDSPMEYIQEGFRINEDSTLHYKSYLFSIRNVSDSAIYLGRMFSIQYMHREAKNKQGDWNKIERQLSEYSFCLTGSPWLFCAQRISLFRS